MLISFLYKAVKTNSVCVHYDVTCDFAILSHHGLQNMD